MLGNEKMHYPEESSGKSDFLRPGSSDLDFTVVVCEKFFQI